MLDIKYYKKWFKEHLTTYKLKDDPMFLFKVKHTGDVLRIATDLGKELRLNEEQQQLVKISALFHDLGRFYQYDKYQVYNDAISCDHTKESMRILKETKILDRLGEKKRDLVYAAISEHSYVEITPGFSDEELLYIKVLRDSDKLANLPEMIAKIDELGVEASGGIDATKVACLLDGKSINIKELPIKTKEDVVLYLLGWLNDLNLPESYSIVEKQGYLMQLVNLLPVDDQSIKLKEVMLQRFQFAS